MKQVNKSFGNSVDILRKKILLDFFKKDQNLFFPGHPTPAIYKGKGNELNVVLMGDSLDSLIHFDTWPIFEHYKIWSMSLSSSEILSELCEIETELLVIDFPEKATLKERSKNLNFFYAGRVSPDKNILLLLEFVNHLQMISDYPVTLKLIGPWDDVAINNLEFNHSVNFKSDVATLIKTLKWKIAPVFQESQIDWINNFTSDDIFISLSQYWMEDFGVSARQAQAHGCRLILSDWGGHKDLSGKDVFRIPIDRLNNALELSNWFVKNYKGHEEAPKYKSNTRATTSYPYEKIKKISIKIAEKYQMDPILFINDWKKIMGRSLL